MSQYFSPEDFRINDLVKELVAKGHDVQVLTGNPNYPSGKFVPGYGGFRTRTDDYFGAKVSRVPHVARGNGSGLLLILNYLTFAVSAMIFGPFLMRGRFDVVFTNQLSPVTVAAPALFLAKVKRAPTVIWVQDLWPQSLLALGVLKGRATVWAATKGTGFLYRGMGTVLIQSPAFRRTMEEQGVEPGRIHYVPNWAEDLYRPVTVPDDAEERKHFSDGFTALFAGNLGEAQSIETIVGAMKLLEEVPDLRWIILGDGRRSSWLQRRVKELGLSEKVELVGRRPVESMPTWFALADVLVATLKSDPVFESTIPSKLQSYLACGRPIIAGMDGEGARVIRESGAGATASAGDEQELANAIRRIYELPEAARQALGESALTYYNTHFGRTDLISKIEDILWKEVDERRKSVT